MVQLEILLDHKNIFGYLGRARIVVAVAHRVGLTQQG
jgi:hypothetical protein